MNTVYVIRKEKHGPGPVSTMAGYQIDGVTIEREYADRDLAQAHADLLNGGPNGGTRGGSALQIGCAYVVYEKETV
jgi:hypothetical protein